MRAARRLGTTALALALLGCGGGGGGGDGAGGDDGSSFAGRVDFPAPESLSVAEVERVVGQAVAEAAARGAAATIAVTDRVGNVLAVYRMAGADPNLVAEARASAAGSGLDGLAIPGAAPVGAIAKAITGAYLSSSGNAFSTRTASQIVQENFNPRERRQPGGPLFGVQFSQLPCSDLSTRFEGAGGARIGPNRSPLGLSADPGGLPLYEDGVVVGGVGVIADGVYGLDRDPQDRESEAERLDELIALAATRGFLPPVSITAERITVEGKTLRYTDQGLDADLGDLRTSGPAALAGAGDFVDVRGYFDAAGGARAGTAYGTPASGFAPAAEATGGDAFANRSAFVLVFPDGAPRFAPRAGSDAPGGSPGARLSRAEVRRILDEALGVALAGRAQIRRPIDSRMQVTVSVVDTNGAVLGVARTPDAPIFGTDVSLQKARSALFLSSPEAAEELAAVEGVAAAVPDPGGGPDQPVVLPPLSRYVDQTDRFVGSAALRGGVAFSARGLGNLARPFYPDGINGNRPGPLSRPFDSRDTAENWSPFSTGLQFDLIGANILGHVFFVLGVAAEDTAVGCTGLAPRDPAAFPRPVLANGLQIFAGGVPIHRGDTVVGAIGVSGDGIDQDDMVASLGLKRAGDALGGFGHAPAGSRSDRLRPENVRLRYVSCPFAPFLGSDAQNVCDPL